MNVSWAYNTLKTGWFYFAGFLSPQHGPHPCKSDDFWSRPCMESSFSVDRTFIHASVATLQLPDEHLQFVRWAPPVCPFRSQLEVLNGQTGGARRAAVASQPMHVWQFCQLKNYSSYTDDSNKFTCSRVWAILKALEALKVKLSCFKGIVNPTHFQ